MNDIYPVRSYIAQPSICCRGPRKGDSLRSITLRTAAETDENIRSGSEVDDGESKTNSITGIEHYLFEEF